MGQQRSKPLEYRYALSDLWSFQAFALQQFRSSLLKVGQLVPKEVIGEILKAFIQIQQGSTKGIIEFSTFPCIELITLAPKSPESLYWHSDVVVNSSGDIFITASTSLYLSTRETTKNLRKLRSSKSSLAIDNKDKVYLADQDSIYVMSKEGNEVRQFGDPSYTIVPRGIAVNEQGEVFVSEREKIHRFDSTGKCVQVFGSRGKKPGQFQSPMGLAIGLEDELHVVDTLNNRIQVFSPDGKFLREFGDQILQNPRNVAVDGRGIVFVSDFYDRICVFARDGTRLGSFGSRGSNEGQFYGPMGLFIRDGSIYVCEHSNHRIQKFSKIKLTP
jgi:hypothetical protein